MTDTGTPWYPSRAAAKDQLAKFIINADQQYASQRNFDRGPSKHLNVSTLSPWIRHRSITEEEVIAAVLSKHGRTAADKFIQEIFWRTYWKGWLEMRPQVWQRYRSELADYYSNSPETIEQCSRVTQGGSGIECFDSWCDELINTGYLHNHARMWFASIWIFTLKLPWQLGADFFIRHLLDGDPASNTLSWRWVAGLHTAGKTYLARPDNIEKYTEGRFNPVGQLSSTAEALTEDAIDEKCNLPASADLTQSKTTGLLLTEEDLYPDHVLALLDSLEINYSTVATVQTTHLRSTGAVPSHVIAFVQQLINDAMNNPLLRDAYTAAYGSQSKSNEEIVQHIIQWATDNNLQQIVTAHAPIGPTAELLTRVNIELKKMDVTLVSVVRDWDRLIWPHASKGFFALKKKIPELLDTIYPTLRDRERDKDQLSIQFE